jgi:hypothetical protein
VLNEERNNERKEMFKCELRAGGFNVSLQSMDVMVGKGSLY